MEKTTIRSNHLNKLAYRTKKGKKKTTVKAIINTRNNKGTNKGVKKGFQNHRMWASKLRK